MNGILELIRQDENIIHLLSDVENDIGPIAILGLTDVAKTTLVSLMKQARKKESLYHYL